MKKTYTKKQISEAIKYWQDVLKKINESEYKSYDQFKSSNETLDVKMLLSFLIKNNKKSLNSNLVIFSFNGNVFTTGITIEKQFIDNDNSLCIKFNSQLDLNSKLSTNNAISKIQQLLDNNEITEYSTVYIENSLTNNKYYIYNLEAGHSIINNSDYCALYFNETDGY